MKTKKLKEFVNKYGTTKNVRTSMTGYKKDEWSTNIPLYENGEIEKIILKNNREISSIITRL